MAHILLGKGIWKDEQLRNQLRSWGVTCGLWRRGAKPGVLPGIWACDAYLLGPADEGAQLKAAQRPQNEPCAPMLAWDGVEARMPAGAPDAAVVPNSGGGGLLASLQVCVAHSAGLRDFQGAVPVLETNPLRVIGHELLTPLTAIQTALEILSDSEDEQQDEDSRQRRHRMLNLALRNTTRLAEAVDWSRGILEPEDPIRPGRSAERHQAGALSAGLAKLAPLVTSADPDGVLAQTEPLLELAGKMLTALREALPGYPVHLHFFSGDAVGTAVLLASPTPGAAPPLGTATPGKQEHVPSWDPWRLALEKSSEQNIPRHLAATLGGELEIQFRDGVPCLALTLPVAGPGECDAGVGLDLRDPVAVP
ncbi:hypothetical protein COW53_10755 [bacterium CG17_big_fil_post_rev_8_21_14_2_50_64_8]|nr:MAG: hypothetical protein COW53_10755 [bacterium CG17_big_fil_post_rev_8_21_14_2_50_64_8]PJA76865.1 MAG: hypothetical protein CO151_01375 [bacterium CG_4_9_14_3_um_filter_65_15]